MIALRGRYIVGLIFLFILGSFFVCVHNTPTQASDAEAETWDLRFMGQTEGSLKMILIRTKIDKDIYSIKGKISGEIDDHIGGIGEAVLKIKGRIENGVFTARLTGQAEMTEYCSGVNGTMSGNISDSQGKGTFRVSHMGGASSGEYSTERI